MHRVVTPQQQRGRLSRSACRPAKAVGGYDVPNLHNRSWGAVTCHYLGMGIRGHGKYGGLLITLGWGRENNR